MRRIIGGLAGLGLVAGAGSVAYHHHGATVQIKGPNGQIQNVHLDFGKKQFQCPSGEHDKLNPLLIRQGRIKLTLQGVEADIRKMHAKYRHSSPPHDVVARLEADLSRGKRLVKAYGATVHEYNAVLARDCSPA